MQIIIEIGMDNSAFDEPLLLPAMLEALASKFRMRSGLVVGEDGPLMDTNGNTCGTWRVTE